MCSANGIADIYLMRTHADDPRIYKECVLWTYFSNFGGRYYTGHLDILKYFAQIIRGHVTSCNAGVINGVYGRFADIFQQVTCKLVKR